MDEEHLSTSLLGALHDQDLELFDQTPVLVDFHFFPKLPIEIRLKVWNFVRPRNLLVFLDDFNCLRTRTPNPVTFRINHESREETMRHYPALFSLLKYPVPFSLIGVTSDPPERVPALHRHFCDANVDTIYCGDQTLRSLRDLGQKECDRLLPSWRTPRLKDPPEDFANIRSLQFRRRDWLDAGHVNGTGGCLTVNNYAYRRYNRYSFWETMRPWSTNRIEYEPGFFSVFRGLVELTILSGGLALRCVHEVNDCCMALQAYYGWVHDLFGYGNQPLISVHLPEPFVYPKTEAGSWACKSCYFKTDHDSLEDDAEGEMKDGGEEDQGTLDSSNLAMELGGEEFE